MMRTRLGMGFLACLATASVGLAQGDKPAPEPPGFYKLDFVVKELDGGKTINSRAYSTTILTDKGVTSIRTGSRILGGNIPVELGINFDCRGARMIGSEFALNIVADVNSIPDPAPTPAVIRTNRWTGDVLVLLRKPTVVFSSDDVTSKRQMQVELTVTPVK